MELILGIYRVMAVLLLVAVMTLIFTWLQSMAPSPGFGLDIPHVLIRTIRETLSAPPESP